MQLSASIKKTFIFNSFLALAVVVIVFLLGLSIFHHYEGTWNISEERLLFWDPGWYYKIVQNGYVYDPNNANNTAFFPLFPYLWKWLGVDRVDISIINAFIFVVSVGVLFRFFPSNLKARLAFLALSIIVFYVTPFTESLFFFFSLFILLGLSRSDRWPLLIIGIIGAGLTRSVVTVFFPAFMVLGALHLFESRSLRSTIPYLGYSLLSLAVLISVFFIHWYQTGEFWAFSITQKHWNSGFRIPNTPFSSWDPQDNVMYDQLALFVGLISIIYLGFLFFRVVIKKEKRTVDDATLFAFLYMAGISLLMLFTRGGGFNSINRYVFSTAFMYMLLRYISTIKITKTMAATVLIVGVAYYLVCWHMGTSLVRIAAATGQLILVFSLIWSIRRSNALSNISFAAICCGLIIIQAIIWFRYFTNVWVG